MEEYANKFLELLRYVRYIRDEKVKVQCFLSGFPQSYKDRIEFYEPRILEEATMVNLITIRHRRTRRTGILTKERKVSNLLTSEISRSSHPKL